MACSSRCNVRIRSLKMVNVGKSCMLRHYNFSRKQTNQSRVDTLYRKGKKVSGFGMLVLFYRKVYKKSNILHEHRFDWLFERWIQSGVLAGWNPHVANLNKSACLFYMLSICSCFFSVYYPVLFSSFQFSVCHSYSIPTKSTRRTHLIKKHT